jgi:hypothetical protein
LDAALKLTLRIVGQACGDMCVTYVPGHRPRLRQFTAVKNDIVLPNLTHGQGRYHG